MQQSIILFAQEDLQLYSHATGNCNFKRHKASPPSNGLSFRSEAKESASRPEPR